MATMCYTDYYNAYNNGDLIIDHVNFNVKLVSEDYTPDKAHKIADVDKFVITAISTIVENDVTTKTMGELIEQMKAMMAVAFENFPDEVCTEVDKIISDKTKRENLKEAIQNFSTETSFDFWEKIRDNGIKYFVVEFVELGILCFCENI